MTEKRQTSQGYIIRILDNVSKEIKYIHTYIQLPIRFLPETDYPRALRSFPRIAGSGNEIARKAQLTRVTSQIMLVPDFKQLNA
jgi:hypothetical protein